MKNIYLLIAISFLSIFSTQALNAQQCNYVLSPTTILVANDTTISANIGTYQICNQAELTYTGSSAGSVTFYIENGGKLHINTNAPSLFGYIYMKSGATLDGGNSPIQTMNIYYVNGATITDTVSPGQWNTNLCANMEFYTTQNNGISACTGLQNNCTATPDTGTIIIYNDTTFSCSHPMRNFFVCNGATVRFTDNSCSNKFFLKPGTTLIFDSLMSYGYSEVFAKAGATVDANGKQIMSIQYETGVTLLDTGNFSSPITSLPCGSMTFDYTNLPGQISPCPAIVSILPLEADKKALTIMPNPSFDQFTIQLPENFNMHILEIISVSGEITEIPFSKNDTHIPISARTLHLTPGMYMILAISDEETLTSRILIQR
jgi:hypothetical protein